jgi:predicted dehydrogenase
MEIYGDKGYVIAVDKNNMRIRGAKMQTEKATQVTSANVAVYEDPFSYFADVLHGKITVPPFGLYSLENNVQVVRILDAARESAKTGKMVKF